MGKRKHRNHEVSLYKSQHCTNSCVERMGKDHITYLHVFDVFGEISALDHLGLVTDPLFRGFVQLLVVIQ